MAGRTEFRTLMEEYIAFLEESVEREKEKYAALVSYDPKRTDKVVAEQQAANMRLAQLEERREEAQRQAGWEGLTFRENLERTDGAEKDTLTGLFERFENTVNEIRFYNSRSLSFANDGLRILGAAGVGQQTGTYDAAGRQRDGVKGASLFETEV